MPVHLAFISGNLRQGGGMTAFFLAGGPLPAAKCRARFAVSHGIDRRARAECCGKNTPRNQD